MLFIKVGNYIVKEFNKVLKDVASENDETDNRTLSHCCRNMTVSLIRTVDMPGDSADIR